MHHTATPCTQANILELPTVGHETLPCLLWYNELIDQRIQTQDKVQQVDAI